MYLALFDLDGVIVSTDHLHFKAWNSIADQNGWRFDETLNHQLRGVSRAESLQIILNENEVEISEEQFEQSLTEKNAVYVESLSSISSQDLLSGVDKLLTELKNSDFKIGIGSSSRNTPQILKQLGITERFDVIVDGNQIKNSKPHPEVFQKGSDATGIPPSQAVVFEDAQAGVEAALAAGMTVIGCGAELLDDVHYMATTVEDLTAAKVKQIISE